MVNHGARSLHFPRRNAGSEGRRSHGRVGPRPRPKSRGNGAAQWAAKFVRRPQKGAPDASNRRSRPGLFSGASHRRAAAPGALARLIKLYRKNGAARVTPFLRRGARFKGRGRGGRGRPPMKRAFVTRMRPRPREQLTRGPRLDSDAPAAAHRLDG